MNNDSCPLMEVLGPVVLILFLTASAMFVALPYALQRHPLDDAPRPSAVVRPTFHLT